MATSHSPLPWQVKSGDVVDANGDRIIQCVLNLALHRSGLGVANAEIAAQAVNVHGDLLQAVKALRTAVNGIVAAVDLDADTTAFTVSAGGDVVARVTLAELLKQAGAAIAKAEAGL